MEIESFKSDQMRYEPGIEPSAKEKELKKDPRNQGKTPRKSSNVNVFLVLLVIICVFSISASLALYMARENERNKRLEVEGKLEEMTFAKKETEDTLQETVKIKGQLEEDLKSQRESYNRALDKIREMQDENGELLTKLDTRMKDISTLKSRLQKEENKSNDLSEQLIGVHQEFEDLKVQISQIRMAKDALENRIIQMSKKKTVPVELGRIVVSEEKTSGESTTRVLAAGTETLISPLPPPAALEGQVLVVNKEFAFVVINLGQKDGLKESEVLDVYRGQQFLGKVQIERIYDTMSSAVILPEQSREEIKEGDVVKLI